MVPMSTVECSMAKVISFAYCVLIVRLSVLIVAPVVTAGRDASVSNGAAVLPTPATAHRMEREFVAALNVIVTVSFVRTDGAGAVYICMLLPPVGTPDSVRLVNVKPEVEVMLVTDFPLAVSSVKNRTSILFVFVVEIAVVVRVVADDAVFVTGVPSIMRG